MSEILICHDEGINWTWYCEVQIQNGFAIIDKEYRLHKFDYSQGAGKHPEAKHHYRIKEKDFPRKTDEFFTPRIAIGIEIDGIFHPFEKEVPRFSFTR